MEFTVDSTNVLALERTEFDTVKCRMRSFKEVDLKRTIVFNLMRRSDPVAGILFSGFEV